LGPARLSPPNLSSTRLNFKSSIYFLLSEAEKRANHLVGSFQLTAYLA
jgi:hypothetical protein